MLNFTFYMILYRDFDIRTTNRALKQDIYIYIIFSRDVMSQALRFQLQLLWTCYFLFIWMLTQNFFLSFFFDT